MQPFLRASFPLAWTLAVLAQSDAVDLPKRVVQRHAAHCHELHRDCAERAAALQQVVKRLVEHPDEPTLQAARGAWITARSVYGQLEALRFSGGPIDAVEVHLNAWPVDEAYIDHVVGHADAGIVNDRQNYRTLSAPLLLHANERGSETNVSVGWHAIEFLLWGQDLDPKGPGRRAAGDFVDGVGKNADRRRAYLTITTELLAGHLAQLRDAWAPGADNYRRRFESDVEGSLRKMLTGAAILTAFELCGERLAVARSTRASATPPAPTSSPTSSASSCPRGSCSGRHFTSGSSASG